MEHAHVITFGSVSPVIGRLHGNSHNLSLGASHVLLGTPYAVQHAKLARQIFYFSNSGDLTQSMASTRPIFLHSPYVNITCVSLHALLRCVPLKHPDLVTTARQRCRISLS